MQSDKKIKFIEGKASEFIKKLAEDPKFRSNVERDPRSALADYVRDINEVPDESVVLPGVEELVKKKDTILAAWEENCFVGHWPLLYR